jgi:hypothetical protein
VRSISFGIRNVDPRSALNKSQDPQLGSSGSVKEVMGSTSQISGVF